MKDEIKVSNKFLTLEQKIPRKVTLLPPLFFGLVFLIGGVFIHLTLPHQTISNLNISIINIMSLLEIFIFSCFLFSILILNFRFFYKNYLGNPPQLINHKFNSTNLPYYSIFFLILPFLSTPYSFIVLFILQVICFIGSIHLLSNFLGQMFFKNETNFYSDNYNLVWAITDIRYPYIGLFYKRHYIWRATQENCLNFSITLFTSKMKKSFLIPREELEYKYLSLDEAERLRDQNVTFLLSIYDETNLPLNKINGYVIKAFLSYEKLHEILDTVKMYGNFNIIKPSYSGKIKRTSSGISHQIQGNI